jgi:hypothetical protein
MKKMSAILKTNRWKGVLISAALFVPAGSLFAAVTNISQLDASCAFSFAAISDTRGSNVQDAGRAFGWIQQYDDFVFEVGDVFDGNTTSNDAYASMWRTNTFRNNNTYPCFGNHCSKINGGNQYAWGSPYFTLTNLNRTGWTFRTPGTATVKAYANSSDEDNKVYTYFTDRAIDYYLTRVIGNFNVHIISIYKQDHSVFFKPSADFLYNRMLTLAASKTKHDIIVVQGHDERWLYRSKSESFAGNPIVYTSAQMDFIAQNADIVMSASDHRFRRINDFDSRGLVNGALHVDTGVNNGTGSGNGYCEFHVFDDPNDPKITMQYINCRVTTRTLHTNRANNGGISINTDRGETVNDQYPAVKYVSGPVTQPLNWSTFNVTTNTQTTTNGAAYISKVTPSTMIVGSVSNVSYTMQNTGTTTWSTDDGQKLGSVNDSNTWGVVRAYLTGSVAPNATTTFNFAVTAPTNAGTYSLQFKMVDDNGNNIGWFGPMTAVQTVNVINPSTTIVTSFVSIATHDGYVDESSETSNVGGTVSSNIATGAGLRVGDTGARKQRKAFVSFNTASLPDNAIITEATLKLKCGYITNNPGAGLGDMFLAIKNTSTGFNGNLNLEAADFQAAASKSYVGWLAYPTAVNTWVTAPLDTNGLARISVSNHTQFRIAFDLADDDDDTMDDYLGFYPGDAATSTDRPVLEVKYR